MPDELSSPPDSPRCKHLRSKEMFYDTGTPEEDRHSCLSDDDRNSSLPPERHGSGVFWCTHTQNCLGPDGAPATAETCIPTRGCYER